MDESLPNTREEKHEAIIDRLNRCLNNLLREIRHGAERHDELVHIQTQIRFHKGLIDP